MYVIIERIVENGKAKDNIFGASLRLSQAKMILEHNRERVRDRTNCYYLLRRATFLERIWLCFTIKYLVDKEHETL